MRVAVGDHISESDHLRYVDGELDETEVGMIEDHLATCMACRDFNDDLAAASDGLAAFLNRADFQPRALAYGPRVAGGWWTSPIGKAAAMVGLLVGFALPAAMLLRVADSEPRVGELAPVVATAPTVPSGAVPRADVPQPPLAPPAEPTPPPVAEPPQRDTGGVPSSFTIDVNSWQSGGELKLVFSSSDVVIYNPGRRTGIASINMMAGLMSIRTTADESADHEIWIPANYGPDDVTVRIAGRRIPFTPTDYVTGDETIVIVGAAPTEVARISLQFAERLRPAR